MHMMIRADESHGLLLNLLPPVSAGVLVQPAYGAVAAPEVLVARPVEPHELVAAAAWFDLLLAGIVDDDVCVIAESLALAARDTVHGLSMTMTALVDPWDDQYVTRSVTAVASHKQVASWAGWWRRLALLHGHAWSSTPRP
jgi:hypothetical protein